MPRHDVRQLHTFGWLIALAIAAGTLGALVLSVAVMGLVLVS